MLQVGACCGQAGTLQWGAARSDCPAWLLGLAARSDCSAWLLGLAAWSGRPPRFLPGGSLVRLRDVPPVARQRHALRGHRRTQNKNLVFAWRMWLSMIVYSLFLDTLSVVSMMTAYVKILNVVGNMSPLLFLVHPVVQFDCCYVPVVTRRPALHYISG